MSKTPLRAGSDSYARERGTRGATTLLKSNVEIDGLAVRLHFRGKGARMVTREIRDRALATTCRNLLALPGRRLFQYRGTGGALHVVRAADVNAFLREVSGVRVSLKDFRTLAASAGVMKALSSTPTVGTRRARKALLRDAIAAAAQDLTNTPTVCRRSRLHARRNRAGAGQGRRTASLT